MGRERSNRDHPHGDQADLVLASGAEFNSNPRLLRAVLLPEFGHVVGLGHVNDSRQLMHPAGDGERSDYGAGDRAGLAAVGSGPCVPTV